MTIKSLIFLLALFGIAVAGHSEETMKRELPVSPGERLVIDLKTGATLDITGWDRDLVAVEARVGGRDADRVAIDVAASGGGARITNRLAKRWRSTSVKMRLEVRVPRSFDVDVSTKGGDVTVRDLHGRVTGTTLGGDLNLSNLKGALDLKTKGGDVRVVDSELDGKVTTMGGQVLLRNVRGNLKGKSMGGDVKLENVVRRDGSSADDSTADGHRDGEIQISSLGGRLDVDEAPEGVNLHTKGGDIQVRSASRFVNAETLAGDIEIGAVDGWVRASTKAGDVDVTLVGDPNVGRRDVEISSTDGNVTLTVPEGLDMRIDVELAYTRDHAKDAAERFRIESDFPLEIDANPSRKRIQGSGTVGDGTHTVKIRTVNGSVHLKRGR